MQESIYEKNEIIEKLISITDMMLKDVGSGDMDQGERALREREKLLGRLLEIDKEIGAVPTPEDERWIQQLQRISSMNLELKERMLFQLDLLRKGLRYAKNQKTSLLSYESIDHKGSQFHGKA